MSSRETDHKNKKNWRKKPSKSANLLSKKLIAWSKSTNKPLKEVATALGVARSTLSGWMKGNRFPGEHNLDMLSEYTGLPLHCLFCVGVDCLEATQNNHYNKCQDYFRSKSQPNAQRADSGVRALRNNKTLPEHF